MTTTYICTQCYEGVCPHANNLPCAAHAYNQDCGCTKGSGVTLLPDYDNIIPEPKPLSFEKFVELLNKESLYRDKYSIVYSSTWRWDIDHARVDPTPYNVHKNGTIIGFVEEDFDTRGVLVNFVPDENCTVYDIRYIREITGWDIKI